MLQALRADRRVWAEQPDPEPLVEAITEFVDAGYTHVYFHQVGPSRGLHRLLRARVAPRLDDARG